VSDASEPHAVLGAAGGTGSAVVRELAGRGLAVRAVTRGGTAAEPLTGRQFLELVFAEAGHPPKIGVASGRSGWWACSTRSYASLT
jgi:uncharacterized protein YbjT (DUF2867 family)